MKKERTSKRVSKKKTSKKTKPLARIDKELYWIFGVMVGLIVVFLASYSIFQSFQTFEYQGLTFTKEKLGDIKLFRYHYFTSPQSTTGAVIGEPRQVNIYLRYDPRENNVPIEGEIEFTKGEFVYVSINSTGLTECEYSSVALGSLGMFLAANGITTKSGVPDEEEAQRDSLRYITCENKPDRMVIAIQSGKETKITKSQGNCHVIDVNNCEILPAIEKFMVQSILDAKANSS